MYIEYEYDIMYTEFARQWDIKAGWLKIFFIALLCAINSYYLICKISFKNLAWLGN